MRVAYYYNIKAPPPHDDPDSNPYGALLCEALERAGVRAEYTMACDAPFLRENQGRIDVLHFNWPHYVYYNDDGEIMARQMHDFVHNLELARDLGYKLIWTVHNLYPHNSTHREIDRECRMAICRLATGVIAHCPVAADGVREQFGRSHNVFVIPHGNYLGVYSYPLSRPDARAKLGIPAEAYVYACLGNIRPYKGIEPLINTFRQLPGTDAWLVVAGGSKDTGYLESVRQQAQGHERVVFRLGCPKPSNDDFLSVPQAADVIVQPYLAATTSGALMLALSWPRPVIAPALGCLPDLVTPDCGVLYDPADKDGLRRALLAIRSFEREAVERAALAVASGPRYNWDEIARQTIEAYRA